MDSSPPSLGLTLGSLGLNLGFLGLTLGLPTFINWEDLLIQGMVKKKEGITEAMGPEQIKKLRDSWKDIKL